MVFQLIVGLGNPGSEYVATRHNIGFRVLEAFALRHRAVAWSSERKHKCWLSSAVVSGVGKVYLAKPSTFMNDSGSSVQKLCSFFKVPPEGVVVVYDETNLDLGSFKLSVSGSSGGHNGVESILSCLPPRFARLRIGIGRKPIKEQPLADYVLGKFSTDEESIVTASMDSYLDSLDQLLREGSEKAMNQINRKQKP